MDHQTFPSNNSGPNEPELKSSDTNSPESSDTSLKVENPKSSWKKKLFGSKNRKLLVAGSAMLLLIVGSLSWRVLNHKTISLPTNVTNEMPMLGAAVTLIDGTAKISDDGGEFTALTTETTLSQGDKITTDAGSRTIITFDDGSIVRLDELSTVHLTSLDPEDIKIDNELGDVYSRVVTSDRAFTVTVDDTDYMALGTAFKTVNAGTVKGVQVVQSTVAVEGEEAKVDEGKQFFHEHQDQNFKDKVTDVSLDELKSDGFMLWNLEQDEKNEAFKDKLGFLAKIKETTPAPVPETDGSGIKLTATTSSKGVVLKWTLNGVSAPDGFKVVRSKKSSTPTYGKDEAHYVGDNRSYTWGEGEGGIFYYRVCAYRPDSSAGCSPYSNTVKIDTPEILPEQPVQGTVTLTINGVEASWTDTGTAPHGWKLNVSTSPNPTYGGKNTESHYTGNPYTIDGLSAGTYYVRVCKYTASHIDNGCTNYSNEVTLVVSP